LKIRNYFYIFYLYEKMQNEKLVTSLFDLVTELKTIIDAQKTEIQTMDALVNELKSVNESQKVELQEKDKLLSSSLTLKSWQREYDTLKKEFDEKVALLRVTEQMRLHDLATAYCYRTRCAELEKELSTLAIQKVDKKLSEAKRSQPKPSESEELELASVDEIVEALGLEENQGKGQKGYWVYLGSDEFVFGDFAVGKASTLVCIGVRAKDGELTSLYDDSYITKRFENLAKRKKVKLVHLQQVWEKMQKESRKVMIFKGLADF